MSPLPEEGCAAIPLSDQGVQLAYTAPVRLPPSWANHEPRSAPVAQLDRALPSEDGGLGSPSRQVPLGPSIAQLPLYSLVIVGGFAAAQTGCIGCAASLRRHGCRSERRVRRHTSSDVTLTTCRPRREPILGEQPWDEWADLASFAHQATDSFRVKPHEPRRHHPAGMRCVPAPVYYRGGASVIVAHLALR